MRAYPAVLVVLGLVSGSALAADTYVFDPGHTQVRFRYEHAGFSNIQGVIGMVSGELVYDAEDPSKSSVTATIPLDAIRTGNPKLDEHLQKDDFFDVANHPTASFVSTAVAKGADGRLSVTGNLSLHGATHPVTLAVTMNGQGEHPMRKKPGIGFDAVAEVRRSDFGVDKYVPVVSDAVHVEITVEANINQP